MRPAHSNRSVGMLSNTFTSSLPKQSLDSLWCCIENDRQIGAFFFFRGPIFLYRDKVYSYSWPCHGQINTSNSLWHAWKLSSFHRTFQVLDIFRIFWYENAPSRRSWDSLLTNVSPDLIFLQACFIFPSKKTVDMKIVDILRLSSVCCYQFFNWNYLKQLNLV